MIRRMTQVEPHPRLWTKAEYYRLGELGFFEGQKVELLDGEIIIQYPEDHQAPGVHYPSNGPHPRLWSKEEYYRLGELGFFQGEKAELLEGEIVVTSPPFWTHYATLDRTAEALRVALGAGFWVRTQAPLDLGLVVEPEPDVSVVPGKREDYTGHPTAALLIVEVSLSTLEYDRNQKASLNASSGRIADYWVLNLVDTQLEIYRNARLDPAQTHEHGYADRIILQAADFVTPFAAPQARIAVSDLLG